MKDTISCLLIDDDADDRDFFKLALSGIEEKIDFHYSPTASEAIENLKMGKYKPDYIFLDLNMMPVNGMECLEILKKTPEAVDIPVIIYSTTINEVIIYETLEAGAFDHFEKPVSSHALVKYLRRIFKLDN